MEAHHLETILKGAYRNARGCCEGLREHVGNDEGALHKARSNAWIASLARALHRHEVSACADEDREQVKVFYRENDEHRCGFLLNEFLHDICVARTGVTKAARRDTSLPVVKRVLWQVESEFNSDTREAAKDFNKLIAGLADKKLFIGPYTGDTRQALSAACAYRKVLREIRTAAEQGCEEEWFMGIVPRPSRWDCDESNSVQVWRFDFSVNEANWVRPPARPARGSPDLAIAGSSRPPC